MRVGQSFSYFIQHSETSKTREQILVFKQISSPAGNRIYVTFSVAVSPRGLLQQAKTNNERAFKQPV